jgi:hypothetical protein
MDADPDFDKARWRVQEAHGRIGEIELARQRHEPALESFHRALETARQIVEADPSSVAGHRQVGIAFRNIGYAHRACARDQEKPPRERLDRWRQAKSCLEKSLKAFADMRERGILAEDDAGVPDEIAAEIAACDAELAGLEHRAP